MWWMKKWIFLPKVILSYTRYPAVFIFFINTVQCFGAKEVTEKNQHRGWRTKNIPEHQWLPARDVHFNHEKTPDKPRVRDMVQNRWLTLLKICTYFRLCKFSREKETKKSQKLNTICDLKLDSQPENKIKCYKRYY